MSVAFVFPGQGSQEVGMGRALAEAFPESRAAFEEADGALGFALSRLCFEGPEADLQLTANTQPAILTASVAALRPLLARGVRPDWVAGHSLGEYSALVAAGAIGFADAVRDGAPARRVHAGGGAGRRGGHGGDPRPRPASDRGGLPRGGGGRGRVARQRELAGPGRDRGARGGRGAGHRGCKAAGAKRAVRLPVSAPFHCCADAAGAGPPRGPTSPAPCRSPTRSAPSSTTSTRGSCATAAECRDGLVRQVSGAVRWQGCIEALVAEGVSTFIEIGPGQVLSGLIKRIAKGSRVLNVDSPESLEAAVLALGAEAEG